MPKEKNDATRRRRHHRHRSCSEEDRLIEARLSQMQKQLDEMTRRERRVDEPFKLTQDNESELYTSSYDDLSLCHLPYEEELLVNDILEADEDDSQMLSVQNDDRSSDPKDSTDREIDTSGLQENILQILGFEPAQKETHGPPIHLAIKPRWMDILISGLSDDVKSEIIKKYVIPENLPELKAPLLNPEVKAALSPQVLRRDERLISKQGQLSGCIAGLGRALTIVLSKEGERDDHNLQLIEYLSDTGRLLCDYFHSEMKVRRELILLNLNKDLRDVLAEAPVNNNFLFGDALEDRLKTAKNLEKAGLELRQSKPKFIKRSPTASYSLNLRGPSRAIRGSRGGHVQARTPYQQRPLYYPYPRQINTQRTYPQDSLVRRPTLNNQDQIRHRLGRAKVENIRQRR